MLGSPPGLALVSSFPPDIFRPRHPHRVLPYTHPKGVNYLPLPSVPRKWQGIGRCCNRFRVGRGSVSPSPARRVRLV
ncbi:hypothetical protein NDU88_001306 [Pleurodeles waltl]|uniref:Uncharacterized protein n=1 Tax=Pleurodeles waltl TaxID=8319 RepID=A0AAV7R7H3_PLEWA|nr:hypothetical protein NDU88_001306 [Pleurodeles waltl]